MKDVSSGKIVGVRLPEFLIKNLEREAEYYSISVSAMIRLILAERYRDFAKLDSDEEGN